VTIESTNSDRYDVVFKDFARPSAVLDLVPSTSDGPLCRLSAPYQSKGFPALGFTCNNIFQNCIWQIKSRVSCTLPPAGNQCRLNSECTTAYARSVVGNDGVQYCCPSTPPLFHGAGYCTCPG
jgi:hypothetical protein